MMQSYSLIIGILPLLAFVILDSFFGMKAGLIVAILLAAAETVFSYYYFGEIDSVTIASLVLVCLMAAVALAKNSRMVFLFQPVILSAGLGIYLLVSFMMGHPIFLEMALKYQHLFPENIQQMLSIPKIREIYSNLSVTAGFGCILHAVLTAFAALRLNKWWWIAVRGIGGHIILVFAFLLAAFFAR